MLKILGVSRSGYYSWLHHCPSKLVIHREKIKEKIRQIYDNSHQNYGAPKIAKELRKAGETLRAHYLFIPIAVANTWQMSTRKQRRKCNVVILKKRILGIMPALNHFMP